MIKLVSEGQFKERIINLYYKELSPLIHGYKTVNYGKAIYTFKETLDIIQKLYDQIDEK